MAEVLLQRTRAATVASQIGSLVDRYPNWAVLARARSKDLQKILKPLGLWRRRAASLRDLAVAMAERRGRFPRQRDEIEMLPGVGQYIANAVQMMCHGIPRPLLDVNMARVLERFFGPRRLADIRYDPYLQDLALRLATCGKPKEVNWAVLDLAALVCRTRDPRCRCCPAKESCSYFGASGSRGGR